MARAIATAIGVVLAFASVARAQTPTTDEAVARDAVAPCTAAALAVGTTAEHACPTRLHLDVARPGDRAFLRPPGSGPMHVARVIPREDRYGSPPPLAHRIHVDHSGDRIAGVVFIVASAIVGITMWVGAYFMAPFATPGMEAYDFHGPNWRVPSTPTTLVDIVAAVVVAVGAVGGYLLTQTRDGSTAVPVPRDYRVTPAIGPSF